MKWTVELESRATGRKTISVSRAENETEAKERACAALSIKPDDCSSLRAEQAGEGRAAEGQTDEQSSLPDRDDAEQADDTAEGGEGQVDAPDEAFDS